ncbi:MAG TPA: BsuPI-related putative proteinase inhibitor [Acidobacteriota bacterium]|jgi:hypothetical protein
MTKFNGLIVLALILVTQTAEQGSCKMMETEIPRSTSTALGGQVEAKLEINRAEYTNDPANITVVQAKFTLRNLTAQPISFQFNSGQIFDWSILDAQGRKVWRWSEGRVFVTMMSERQLGATPWNFEEEIPLASEDNIPYPAGNYTLVAELAADKKASASVPFRIVP